VSVLYTISLSRISLQGTTGNALSPLSPSHRVSLGMNTMQLGTISKEAVSVNHTESVTYFA